ncbi:MAG: hypothetical protein ABI821_20580 [Pseudomonadota bacterium]
MNSTADRLRRATALWHAYLTITGKRFDLSQFLKDTAFEKQTLDIALASGEQKLIGLAQDWLLGTGQALPKAMGARVAPPAGAAPVNGNSEAPKLTRYLRGVR